MAETIVLAEVEVRNFRSFVHSRLHLEPDATLLVADNGGGKTALLDAVSVALSALIPAVRPKRSKGPGQRGIDLLASDARSTEAMPPYQHSEFPAEVRAAASVLGQPSEWSVTLESADHAPESSVEKVGSFLASPRRLRELPPVDTPVVAYYGTSRSTSSVYSSKMPTLGRIERVLGYKNSLNSGANYAEITAWLAQTEWERTSTRGSAWEPVLNCVYEAATGVLAPLGVTAIEYSLEERDLVVEFKVGRDGRRALPMSMLSDGLRSVLALVADLAFRCGALNAHLDADAAQLTDGVVLIDEIDMHLHPKWQASIVSDLMRTFPRIQFVITTHSPLVVSSVEGRQVRRIEDVDGAGVVTHPDRQTKGADVDYISEAILDAPTRGDAEYASDLEALAELMAAGDVDGAEGVAERVRSRKADTPDFDADRLLREYEWRRTRSAEQE